MKNLIDSFGKYFIYFFAVLIALLTFGYDYAIFFVKYNEQSRDIINMIAGVLNTSCLVMVVGFFFGSTSGSKEKTNQMLEMMKEKTEKKDIEKTS